MNMNRTSWTLVAVFLLFASMLGIWCMDGGASAMAADGDGVHVQATNGFWFRSPLQQYHLGLAMTILSMLALTFVAVRSIAGDLTISKNRGGL